MLVYVKVISSGLNAVYCKYCKRRNILQRYSAAALCGSIQLQQSVASAGIYKREVSHSNLRREPHSIVTVRRFRKRKNCCHVIAIAQAGIADPTLTVVQGFKAKKRLLHAFAFPLRHTASILRIHPFHAFVTQARIEPGCDGWKAKVLTTTLAGRSNAAAKCRI